MAGGNNRDMILHVTFSLLILSLLEVISIEAEVGPCSVPIENIAVYEGDQNTFIAYPSSDTRVKFSIQATTDELSSITIVDHDNIVQPTFASDFVASSAGFRFMNATTLAAPGHELSTAGLYTAECGGSELSFKLLVVRSGPTCSCKPDGSSRVQLTCSAIYADSTYDPISAIFTFSVDGKRIDSDIPQRVDYDGYTWLSESTFTADYKSSSILQCNMTFDIPREVQDPSVAMNAPKFNQNCSVSVDECGLTKSKASTTKTPKATETVPPKDKQSPASPVKVQATTQPSDSYSPLDLKTFATKRYTELLAATTLPPTMLTTPSTSGCNCALNSSCPSTDANCKRSNECDSDGIDMTGISAEPVVNAELKVILDKCCQGNIFCGVVVTLRNNSRWLIHDPVPGDKKCQMSVVDASCMSSDWTLVKQTKVTKSDVGDYVKRGDSGLAGQDAANCIDSCNRMINLS